MHPHYKYHAAFSAEMRSRAENRLGATSLSGGVLPLMVYIGWLLSIGVPFSGFDYIKGEEYPKLMNVKR